ncbi:MAG: putative quinol monooxygenase [Thermodesulfobacteriota bacterium]
MITASIKMYGRPEKRKEIIQTIKGLSSQIRQGEQCMNVSVYQDINDENVFYLVEEWKNEKALKSHFNSEYYAALLGAGILLKSPPQVKCMVNKGPECCNLREDDIPSIN